MTGNLSDAISGHYEQQGAEAEKRREATNPTSELTRQPGGFIALCEAVGRGFEQVQREAEYKRSNRNA